MADTDGRARAAGVRGPARLAVGPAVLLAALLAWAGCADSPAAPSEETRARAYFETVWADFDSLYSFFVLKGIDWDATGDRHRARLDPASGSAELFAVLRDMLGELEDPHVFLEAGRYGRWQYTGWYDRYPANFDLDVVRARFGDSLQWSPGGRVLWGWATAEIAYVHIPSFGGDGWDTDLATVGEALAQAGALIFDIRDNGGGNDAHGREIARRIVDQRRLFRVIRWRDGPAHDDFGPPIEDYLEPAPGERFEGPVVVLTNRRVLSSAEGFVLMMRVIPGVVVVGDTTGGGSANPAIRTLPNGWRYSVSRWWVRTPDGESFEGVGLGPDVFERSPKAELQAGRDPILERAIRILEAGLGT